MLITNFATKYLPARIRASSPDDSGISPCYRRGVTPKSSAVGVQCPRPVGRTFRLTYSNGRPDDDAKLFRCRDAMAFCELNAELSRVGYDYATTIYLYPDDDRPLSDFPALQASDLLVLTTRPPLTT